MFVVKNSPEMVNKTFRLPADLVQQCCEYALNDLPDALCVSIVVSDR